MLYHDVLALVFALSCRDDLIGSFALVCALWREVVYGQAYLWKRPIIDRRAADPVVWYRLLRVIDRFHDSPGFRITVDLCGATPRDIALTAQAARDMFTLRPDAVTILYIRGDVFMFGAHVSLPQTPWLQSAGTF